MNLLTALSQAATLPPHELAALTAWCSTFYPFQRAWMLEPEQFAIYLKSRKIGISYTPAAACTLWGAYLGETTTVLSVGEREALEVLEFAKRHADVLAQLGSRMAKAYRKGEQLIFASGGRIVALPSSSGGRSYGGNVVLDEFAYVPNQTKLWDGAGAVAMHGFRVRVLSTPNGIGEDFHNLWTNPQANRGYSKHLTTVDAAISQGMKVDLDACWKMAKGDPRIFDQLFRCKFLDGAEQYIPSEAIELCSADVIQASREDTAYAGLDIGRTADRTVLVVLRVDRAGVARVVAIHERKRTSSDDLDNLARIAFETHNVRRLCVDASGLGVFPAERMQRVWGANAVEPVVFTQQSKEDLATTMYTRFCDHIGPDPKDPTARKLYIPRIDTRLRDDIASLRREVTSAGNVRYTAPVTDRGHADRAWALALALHACSGPNRQRHES